MKKPVNMRLNQTMIDAIKRVCQREEITLTRFIKDGIKLNLKEYKEAIDVEKIKNTWGDDIDNMPLY